MSDKYTRRSDRYQCLYFESTQSSGFWSFVAQRTKADLDLYPISAEIQTLRDELTERLREVAKECLTKKQFQIFCMYFVERMTMTDIAKELGVNQSSITKTLHGSASYSGGKKTKTYGGSMKKLIPAAQADPKCLEILQRIAEQEEKESQ